MNKREAIKTYKGISTLKGKGKRFNWIILLFPIEKNEKKIKKKKKKISPIVFLIFSDI